MYSLRLKFYYPEGKLFFYYYIKTSRGRRPRRFSAVRGGPHTRGPERGTDSVEVVCAEVWSI